MLPIYVFVRNIWQIKVIKVTLIDDNEGTKHGAIEDDNNNQEIKAIPTFVFQQYKRYYKHITSKQSILWEKTLAEQKLNKNP